MQVRNEDDVKTLASHGHHVVELGGAIVAAAQNGRLSNRDLEDLMWRSVAAHLRLAAAPDDEGRKDAVTRSRELLDAYIDLIR